MGFAVRSQYTQYILPIIPSRWLSIKHLQSTFGRKRNNWSSCHSAIFARQWHHISICFKPFDVNHQARFLESLKSASPMILRASFKGLVVESYLSCLLYLAMVCHSIVRHSTECPHPLPAKSLYIVIVGISWLVIVFKTSAPPEMVPMTVEQRFKWRISISTFLIFFLFGELI